MKLLLTTAALALSTASALAQAGETGVSHPDNTPITVDVNEAPAPQATPAPQTTPAAKTKPSPYVPYSAPAPATYSTPAPQPAFAPTSPTHAPLDPDADIVTTDGPPPPPAAQKDDSVYQPYRPYTAATTALASRAPEPDPDAGIVTEVPLVPGEMPEGTLLKVRIDAPLSTVSTAAGSTFSATFSDAVMREGKVVIPAGAVLNGQVTEIHGGHRISGRAAIHLEPRRVTLPDGSYYVIHAQIIDTTEEHRVTVNGEGTIYRRDHAKETLAIVTATTGTAAVAGAMIGGGVGAAVGAGIGAGISTVLWLKQDRQAALPRNTGLVFSLTTPMRMHPLQDGAQLHP